jgi:hypothetical protein
MSSWPGSRCPHCGCVGGIHNLGCPNYGTAQPYPISYYVYPSTGWICPRCQKVNAPWISSCDCPAPATGPSAKTGEVAMSAPDLAAVQEYMRKASQPDNEQCKGCESYPMSKCMPPQGGRPCEMRKPKPGFLDNRQCSRCEGWGRSLCAPPIDGSPCVNRKEMLKTMEQLAAEELLKREG